MTESKILSNEEQAFVEGITLAIACNPSEVSDSDFERYKELIQKGKISTTPPTVSTEMLENNIGAILNQLVDYGDFPASQLNDWLKFEIGMSETTITRLKERGLYPKDVA